MKFQKKPIAAAVALVLMSASINVSAQIADPAAEPVELDAVKVVGIRGSLEESLETKREDNNRVEVITAEDIGKMPDKNVADSLARVSGVNISAASANEGAFDENDRVSMRGTSPSLTQTTINGHGVASGDWFVLNQTGTVGRSVSYSLLPSEVVSKVIVRKSSEASLVEGGAVGTVDIITRSPLEFTKEFTTELSLGAVYADLPDQTSPQASGLFNWKNEASSFGVMVQAFYEQRNLRRDGQELLGYDTIKATDAAGIAHADLIGVYYPVLIGSALFEQERTRTGGLVSVEFKPTDSTTFAVNYFMSSMDAENYNRNYMLWGSRIIGSGGIPKAGYVVKDNTLVTAEFAADPNRQFGIYDQIARPDSSSDSDFLSLDGKWDVSEKLSLTTQLGTSNGNGKTPTQNVAEWDVGKGTGAGWALHGIGAADWNLGTTDTSQPGTPGVDISLDWIFGLQNVNAKDKEQWAQIDGEYFVDSNMITTVQFGARYADHSRSVENVVAQGPNWGTDPFNPAHWPSGYENYPGNFGSGLGGNFPRNIWYYTAEQLAQFNDVYANRDVSRTWYPAAYDLEESSTAAYTQINIENGDWQGNVGLRYVQTIENSKNYTQTSALNPIAVCDPWGVCWEQVDTKNTYNNFLPSANLRWAVSEDVVARFAASQTLTRPDYSALAGAVSLSPPAVSGGVGTGTGGNPNLRPIISSNLDATLEWYFAPRSLLTGSLFYMDISNYVDFGHTTATYWTVDANNPQGAYVDYIMTVPVNSNAEVKGFEIAYEQAFGENFGGFANYTYADGSTETGTPMLGTSKNTYNVGAYFENDMFNARLNYTYRSSFYSGLDRASAFFQDDVGVLSASVGYTINDSFMITLDGMNLNNPQTAYYAESKERPRSIYENGRQYYLNLRMKF
ncbi:MAG: TonB-dependent receptor [Polaromonas sp.]|nr:TonB-dependent receptor [Polaromonas sp.]